MVADELLRAGGHLTVEEQEGLVEIGVEGETEPFPVHLGVRYLWIVLHAVVLGADVLDEEVLGGYVGVGVRGDEAGLDHEVQVWICSGGYDLKTRGRK